MEKEVAKDKEDLVQPNMGREEVTRSKEDLVQ